MENKRLEEILSIQTESYKQWRMFAYIIRRIRTIPNAEAFVHNGNVYITKGSGPVYPCVVAHMDTVHTIGEDLSIIRAGSRWTGFNRVTMRQTGIGGDDKVGIYIAFECLEKFDNIKIVFFRDEEIGCGGSYKALLSFFDDCSFVLQADRRGNSDFVTNASGTPLSSKQFKKAIKSTIHRHGYKFEQFGMMTDVMALKDIGLKVSCANVSCGYYSPHEDHEWVELNDIANCLALFVSLIEQFGSRVFHHTPEKKSYNHYTSYGKSYKNYSERNWWDEDQDPYNDMTVHTDKHSGKSFLDSDDGFEETHVYDRETNTWKEVDHRFKKSTKQSVTIYDYCESCEREEVVTYDREMDSYLCDTCARDLHGIYTKSLD